MDPTACTRPSARSSTARRAATVSMAQARERARVSARAAPRGDAPEPPGGVRAADLRGGEARTGQAARRTHAAQCLGCGQLRRRARADVDAASPRPFCRTGSEPQDDEHPGIDSRARRRPLRGRRHDAHDRIIDRDGLPRRTSNQGRARRARARFVERPLPPEKFYIPGTLLEARVDNTNPVAYGVDGTAMVFFDHSPAFRLEPEAALKGVRPVARLDTATPLRAAGRGGNSTSIRRSR